MESTLISFSLTLSAGSLFPREDELLREAGYDVEKL